jgi:hypothetical protein
MATLQYNQGLDWQLHSWRKIIKRTPKKKIEKAYIGKVKENHLQKESSALSKASVQKRI